MEKGSQEHLPARLWWVLVGLTVVWGFNWTAMKVAIAEGKPERVVCLDEGFAGNDQLKANAVQTFKTKGIVKFQTV